MDPLDRLRQAVRLCDGKQMDTETRDMVHAVKACYDQDLEHKEIRRVILETRREGK